MTPPWTDASTDFETGFDQNDAEKLECCVESTVRCYYPEDYVNCYPWPEEYAVTDRTLRSIKCVDGDDRESSVKYDGSDKCVVTGDRGGFYVTPSGFGPTQQGASDNGLQVEFTRYAVQALSNSTKGSDLLAAGRIKWTFDGRLEAILLAGTNGAMLHLVPTISEEAADPEEFVFQHTGTVDDMIYISEYDRDSELFTKQTMDDYYVVVLGGQFYDEYNITSNVTSNGSAVEQSRRVRPEWSTIYLLPTDRTCSDARDGATGGLSQVRMRRRLEHKRGSDARLPSTHVSPRSPPSARTPTRC